MARFNKRFISNRKQGHKQTRGQAHSASRKRKAKALKGLGLALEASKTDSTIAQVQQRRFARVEQARKEWWQGSPGRSAVEILAEEPQSRSNGFMYRRGNYSTTRCLG